MANYWRDVTTNFIKGFTFSRFTQISQGTKSKKISTCWLKNSKIHITKGLILLGITTKLTTEFTNYQEVHQGTKRSTKGPRSPPGTFLFWLVVRVTMRFTTRVNMRVTMMVTMEKSCDCWGHRREVIWLTIPSTPAMIEWPTWNNFW